MLVCTEELTRAGLERPQRLYVQDKPRYREDHDRLPGFPFQHPIRIKNQSWPLALHCQDWWPGCSSLARGSHISPNSVKKRLSKTSEKGLTSPLSWRKGNVGTLDAGGHGQGTLSGWMHLLLKMNRACLHLSGYTCSHQVRISLVLQSYASNSLPENLEAQSPRDWVMIPRYRPWPPVALTQANSSLASSYRQA